VSIEVPIAQLGDELERRPFGYLITVGDDLRPHVVALRPRLVAHDGGPVVRFDAGSRRAAHNIAERPAVTIVFPPTDEGGMSLIVDGTAVDRTDPLDHDRIDIVPTWAVLHRDAPANPDR
jgi:hypothetical protein